MVDKGKVLEKVTDQEKLLSAVREKFVEISKKIILLKRIICELQEEENMTDEIKIPVFDGKDYSTWKKRILTFLKLKKCEETCKRERQQNENADDWNQKDLKAVNYIYSALSNKQMEFINDEETAYEIIKKLDKLYLKESTALQICVRNKLEKIKLKDYNETSEFFSNFEKLIIELKNAGAQVTEKEKLNYLLRTLPSSLSYIGDFVDVMAEEDRTADFVKDKIKMHDLRDKEEKRNEKSRDASTNVFHIEKKKEKKNVLQVW